VLLLSSAVLVINFYSTLLFCSENWYLVKIAVFGSCLKQPLVLRGLLGLSGIEAIRDPE